MKLISIWSNEERENDTIFRRERKWLISINQLKRKSAKCPLKTSVCMKCVRERENDKEKMKKKEDRKIMYKEEAESSNLCQWREETIEDEMK